MRKVPDAESSSRLKSPRLLCWGGSFVDQAVWTVVANSLAVADEEKTQSSLTDLPMNGSI